MKDRKPHSYIYIYIYISILVIIIILTPRAIARFTTNKKYDGNINIKNHPGGRKLRDAIIEDNGGINAIKAKGTPDFSKIATTKEGIFMAEDDYGESYYYRGMADNWVSFAGFYWRIIRINGDSSIRLIYSGTKENHTGYYAQIGQYQYNRIDNNEKYANYKISNIKTIVDKWYKTNILEKGYDDKVADTGYCNDMTKKNTRDFDSYDRLFNYRMPILKCPNKANDLLSKSNNKLTYPIGLLTHDEASFGGGLYYDVNPTIDGYYKISPSENQKYYLYIGPDFGL